MPLSTSWTDGQTVHGSDINTIGAAVNACALSTSGTLTTPTITVLDNAFTVQNVTTPTKQAQFLLSAITAGNTRTYTLPDTSDTLVTLAATQALTQKDLTGAGNTFPTLNQNTTGSAAKWTTARNLAGNSVDGSATVAFANKFVVQGTTDTGLSSAQFLGALGTGLVKNTTTTGVLTIGAAGTDYVAPGSSPYDMAIMGFGSATARAASSYGDNPMGIKCQRAATFTSVTFRVNTADASGNLVCELRKNGTQISGTSTTIAAASQVAGGTSTGSWAVTTGDIITVFITAVGTTPGNGLVADVTGTA
jgi:hypothetical protein